MKPKTDTYLVQQAENETHEIERKNLDISQGAAVERRGYGRVRRTGVHRDVADLRRWTRAARELGANEVHLEFGCFVWHRAIRELPVVRVKRMRVCGKRGHPQHAPGSRP